MERDQGGLEVRSHANTSDDLKDNDFAPGSSGVEVNEQPKAERHDQQAEPDGWEVLAGLLDEDASGGGGEREGQGEREEVDAGEKGRGAEDGLEVEGEVVGSGYEDEAVEEADAEGCDGGALFEQT